MNIFKILASGDGSINEPNVSAFLGYLLNPNEDHGLGDELLKKVLLNLYEENAKKENLVSVLLDKENKIRSFSSKSSFEIKVLLEQAFRNEGKNKSIVDIVILCYEKKTENIESLAQAYISGKKTNELKHIFLIENKIKDESAKTGQLINQYDATINEIKKILEDKNEFKTLTEDDIFTDIKKIVSLIFICPDGPKSNDEYDNFEKEGPEISKTQIYWSYEENSIVDYLKEILEEEANGNVEAIYDHAKHTIKSFINFVENDFKSTIEEELEGERKKNIIYDLTDYKNKYSESLNGTSWTLLEKFCEKIKSKFENPDIRHSPTHPFSFFLSDSKRKEGKKIFALSKSAKNLVIRIIFSKNNISEKLQVKNFLTKQNINFKERHTGSIEIINENLNLQLALDLFEFQYNLITQK